MANKEAVLASYIKDKIIAIDTARLNAKGVGVFQKNKKLASGEYLFYLTPTANTNIFVGTEQDFEIIVTDTSNIHNDIRYEGSSEQNLLTQYRDELKLLFEKQKIINEEFNQNPDKERKEVVESYRKAHVELEEKHRSIALRLAKEHPGTMATFFRYYLRTPAKDFSQDIPEGTEDREHKIALKNWSYQKKHYWDYVDFTDSLILNLHKPSLDEKLNDYFENHVMVLPHPDSLFRACDELVIKSRSNKGVYRHVLEYCMMYCFENKIMGMDEAFVKIVQKYYMTGKVDWRDEKSLKTVTDEAIKRQYNLIGHKAVELQLPTIDGQVASLHEIKAPFTLVIFWEPNCGHCKKQVPLAKKEIYDRFSPYGLKVYAVHAHTNKEAWEEFVEKHELFDFINVWDPNNQSHYRTLYNAFTTPAMYILDKEKKFIAKNLSIEQMVDLLKNEYKKQGVAPIP